MKVPTTNQLQYSNTEVLEELDSILASKAFVHSPQLSKFLKTVVDKTLSGNGHEIKEYTVGIEVLGKPFNFNPMLDASVRICANRLRKQLKEFYLGEGSANAIRIDLPKGSYRPAFLSGSLSNDSAASTLNDVVSSVNPEVLQDLICIMPFAGFINHESLDFSITGFCSFLSEKLSLFQDISVVSFHSVSVLLESGGTYEQLEKELGVTYFLTGSIEIEKDMVLVAVQLNDARSHKIIWSQTFSNNTAHSSFIDIVDGISDQIVAALAGYSGVIHFDRFLKNELAPAISNKMANAIFWFYHYQLHHSKSLFYEAVMHLEQAVQEDAGYALSWAILAQLYTDGVFYHYSTVADPLSVAQECVNKSLAIDPNCQHAYLINAWIAIFRRNKEVMVENVEHCLRINPKATYFLSAVCLGYGLVGEYERSRTLHEQASKLNPLPYWWLNLPNILVSLKHRDFEKMLFYARKIGTPAVIYEHVLEMIALFFLGEMEALKKLVRLHQQKYPQKLNLVAQGFLYIISDQDVTSQIEIAMQHILKMGAGANTGSSNDLLGA